MGVGGQSTEIGRRHHTLTMLWPLAPQDSNEKGLLVLKRDLKLDYLYN